MKRIERGNCFYKQYNFESYYHPTIKKFEFDPNFSLNKYNPLLKWRKGFSASNIHS